jgi:hypothetical protein
MALLIQSEEAVSRQSEPMPIAELSASEVPTTASNPTVSSPPAIERVYRHRLPVRISHCLNNPFLIILIMSGLQIFTQRSAIKTTPVSA